MKSWWDSLRLRYLRLYAGDLPQPCPVVVFGHCKVRYRCCKNRSYRTGRAGCFDSDRGRARRYMPSKERENYVSLAYMVVVSECCRYPHMHFHLKLMYLVQQTDSLMKGRRSLVSAVARWRRAWRMSETAAKHTKTTSESKSRKESEEAVSSRDRRDAVGHTRVASGMSRRRR